MERLAMKGRGAISLREFKYEISKTRITSQDIPYLLKEMQQNGWISVRKKMVELKVK